MIPDRSQKLQDVINFIATGQIKRINTEYRRGPSLYFYKRVVELRQQHRNVRPFLADNYSLEILYATLVSWDMNSRRAKMKYYDDFKANLLASEAELCEVEKIAESFHPEDCQEALQSLEKGFAVLKLMESRSSLVSNSKCLHFLFPSLCMPMDRTNTLSYLYGNTNESGKKYMEIAQFSFDVMKERRDFDRFLDKEWNVTIPKMIDNAIILLQSDKQKQSPAS